MIILTETKRKMVSPKSILYGRKYSKARKWKNFKDACEMFVEDIIKKPSKHTDHKLEANGEIFSFTFHTICPRYSKSNIKRCTKRSNFIECVNKEITDDVPITLYDIMYKIYCKYYSESDHRNVKDNKLYVKVIVDNAYKINGIQELLFAMNIVSPDCKLITITVKYKYNELNNKWGKKI